VFTLCSCSWRALLHAASMYLIRSHVRGCVSSLIRIELVEKRPKHLAQPSYWSCAPLP
jgi:hypothetical protein